MLKSGERMGWIIRENSYRLGLYYTSGAYAVLILEASKSTYAY